MRLPINAYLAYSRLERENCPEWLHFQEYALRAFCEGLPAKTETLQPYHLSKHLEACERNGESAAYLHNRAVVIRAFARWMLKSGLVSVCPLAQTLIKAPKTQAHPLPPFETLTAILEAIPNPDARDAAQLLQLTGARRSEVIKAPWREFNLEKGLWNLEGSRTKSRRGRAVPLTRAAVAILTRRRDADPTGKGPFMNAKGRGLHPSSVTHAFMKAARAKGWHGTRLHDLRHAYGTRSLNELGADIVSIQSVMGHARIETTRRYLHPNPDHAERLKALWEK